MAVTSQQASPDFFEQALRWRERQYATLAELALLAIHEEGIEVVLGIAAERLQHALDADFTKVLDHRAGATGLFLRAGAGWPDGVVGHREVPEGAMSQGGYALEVDEPVIVTDLAAETRFEPPPLLLEHGVRSGISVVMRGDGRVVGVLQVDKRETDRFGPGDIPVVQAYADVLGAAIAAAERAAIAMEYAALAAHELRTPLTVIIGHVDRLLARREVGAAPDDEAREALIAVKEESARLQRTIELFLAFGDAERRAAPVELRLTDPVAAVDEVVEAVRGRYPDRRLTLRADDSVSAIELDDVALSRVVSNLVENAAKYSPPGATVTVSVSTQGDVHRIEVTDACGGMTQEELRSLFSWSFRGVTQSHGAREGLGLGLYVARRLSDRQGWRLAAENRDGGCAFVLDLSPG